MDLVEIGGGEAGTDARTYLLFYGGPEKRFVRNMDWVGRALFSDAEIVDVRVYRVSNRIYLDCPQ